MWLIILGIVILIFGVLFISSREVLLAMGVYLNEPATSVNKIIKSYRFLIGGILVVIGGWVTLVAFSYPDLWYLYIIGIFLFLFGFLYLFLPGWLDWLSKTSDQVLFSMDEAVIGARKSLGIILIITALYVFYSAYLWLR